MIVNISIAFKNNTTLTCEMQNSFIRLKSHFPCYT